MYPAIVPVQLALLAEFLLTKEARVNPDDRPKASGSPVSVI
jgi:hypothetical protein